MIRAFGGDGHYKIMWGRDAGYMFNDMSRGDVRSQIVCQIDAAKGWRESMGLAVVEAVQAFERGDNIEPAQKVTARKRPNADIVVKSDKGPLFHLEPGPNWKGKKLLAQIVSKVDAVVQRPKPRVRKTEDGAFEMDEQFCYVCRDLKTCRQIEWQTNLVVAMREFICNDCLTKSGDWNPEKRKRLCFRFVDPRKTLVPARCPACRCYRPKDAPVHLGDMYKICHGKVDHEITER